MATTLPAMAAAAKDDKCKARNFPNEKTKPKKDCPCCNEPDGCKLHTHRPACCPDGYESHHVLPVRNFLPMGARKNNPAMRHQGCEKYNINAAPCICLSKPAHVLTHSKYHAEEKANRAADKTWTLDQATDAAAKSVAAATADPKPGCKEECLKAALDKYHQTDCEMDGGTTVRATSRQAPIFAHIPPSATPAVGL